MLKQVQHDGVGSFRTALTDTLEIAYHEHGDAAGAPLLMLHGFPYDPSAFDAIVPILAEDGFRVIIPYLRGYGPTRFRDPQAFRGGEQAAIADDIIQLMGALHIDRALIFGFDWGGRAACIIGALWPDRVQGLVVVGGYLIQNIAQATTPAPMPVEHMIWHQYFLASERGRNALIADRKAVALHLRTQWSPKWPHHDDAIERAAPAFDNPDFVDVVCNSYAHRIGAAAGEPRFAAMEEALSAGPDITVPTILLRGGGGGLGGSASPKFTRLIDQRVAEGAGHNPAQESPAITAAAIRDLWRATIPAA
ncbi:alpha/beta fold hydrolase [Sphingomonas sp. MMS24-J13]|uniref:alpha/beta fold hydrolase n=1 Tax=Sphingomonas sp. MMS24-J13 TaxID=3238686 RepID=UPI00384B7A9E